MSTAPFPQLLRRSAFASHDPFISRVYTSTPSSIRQHGDWGLKYPIHRAKGPLYIKLSKLDAGKVIGSDWRSAEQEARFVQTWGTGRVSWMTEEEMPRYQTREGRSNLFDDYVQPSEERERQVELMEDVNAMSPGEFEDYLGKVRRKRKAYLKVKLGGLRQQTKDKLALPEDQTLVTLGTRGYVANPDTATFQVGLAKEEVEAKDSEMLHSSPHAVHGLSYSRLPPISTVHNPMLHHAGRAIEKVSQLSDGADRARSFRPGEGTNRPWVVGLGSLAAKSKTSMGRISDAPTLEKGVDFTREDEHRGEARWRVTTASLKDPPRVLGLTDLTESQRSVRRGRQESAAKKISALDTFRFDITVEHVSRKVDGENAEEAELELGSREWVGREPKAPKVLSSWSDDLGLGGPRGERKQGDGARSLRSWEQRADRISKESNAEQIDGLLARLVGNAQ